MPLVSTPDSGEVNRNATSTRVAKALATCSFSLLSAALISISPAYTAQGYEISIYTALPWYFWAFLVSSLVAGQLCVVTITRTSHGKRSFERWLLPMLAADLVLLVLPVIRGYPVFGRWDQLTHVGLILDILQTGHVTIANVYPPDHLLAVSMYFLADVSIYRTLDVIPALFSFLYIGGLYLTAKALRLRQTEIAMVMVLGAVLMFGQGQVSFGPDDEAFFLAPLVICLFLKSRVHSGGLPSSVAFVIMLFAAIFYHPMTAFYLITIFTSLAFAGWIAGRHNASQLDAGVEGRRKSVNVVVLTIVTFFVWYFSFAAIVNSVVLILDWLVRGAGTTQFQNYSDLLAQSDVRVADILSVFLGTYGQLAIMGAAAAITSLSVLFPRRKPRGASGAGFAETFCSIGFLAFTGLSVVFLFGNFIVGFGRVTRYALLFATVLLGVRFSGLLDDESGRPARLIERVSVNHPHRMKGTLRFAIPCVLMILVVFFSVFNLYWSPIVKKENQQVSMAEIDGSGWLFLNRDDGIPIYELGISQLRMFQALYGDATPAPNVRYGVVTRPADHFGYSNGTFIGSTPDAPSYLLITDLGRESYPELYPGYQQEWRFTPTDFQQLHSDPTVAHIYSNGNVDIHWIVPSP